MRSLFLLLIPGLVALEAACGGQTGGIGNGDGGSTSSSGGGGGRGGTSGGSSSGSASSSGGGACSPLPGCSSSTECPSPNGCGFCDCSAGEWVCPKSGCLDAAPVEDAPSSCLSYPPPDGAACSDVGAQCFYADDAGCGGGDACFCQPSGTWLCEQSVCIDAGSFDGGFFDSGDGCPASQPPNNEACSTQGNICSYFTSCETNCLCASSGWVCATQENCGDL